MSESLRRIRPCWIALLTGSLLLAASPTLAQDFSESAPAQPEIPVGDALGRDTPRGSFEGLMRALEQFDYMMAEEYMDLRNLPADVRRIEGEDLAQYLNFILQRTFSIDPTLLSNRKEGQPYDGLPDYRDELGRIKTADGEIVLLMQRVPGPEKDFIWKISNVTMAQVPELYEYFSYPDWVTSIYDRMPKDRSFLGIELFKWVIVIALILVFTPILVLAGYGLTRLISRRSSPLYINVKRILMGPIPTLIALGIGSWLFFELGLGASGQRLFQAATLTTIAWVWLIFAVIDLFRAKRRVRYEAMGRTDAAVLGRPMANAVKLVTLIAALLIWLLNAGFDLTTVLAGLGIGGVAMALALQKPIEDLLGSISIYSQQQLVTGDLCRYGTALGRVEEIGLRTTSIRTLSNTLVSVPNSQLAYGMIENLAARTKILYHPKLQLRYDTSAEQLQHITGGMQSMLRDNPRVEDSTIRVRVSEFTDNAIIIRMRIFALTREFEEYLEIVEEVNLAIMRILDTAGAHFAQGARSVFIEGAEETSSQG